MRVRRLVQTFVLFTILALPVMAQSTGASVMSTLGDNLRRELRQYQVEGTRDVVRLLDRESGAEVLSVRATSPYNVSITATIGTYAGLSREMRSLFLQRIALFNFSSPVGTLTYDDRSNTVVMSHNMNASVVPVQQMVHIASLCGDVARAEARLLAQ